MAEVEAAVEPELITDDIGCEWVDLSGGGLLCKGVLHTASDKAGSCIPCTHEWQPVQNPRPGQAIPYEILRQDELPHTINPPAGWFVNANNDPAGTVLDNDPLNQLRQGVVGIYYLNPGYSGGFRAGTITARIRDYVATQGELSKEDLQSIQADVSLLDAKFFVPCILAAFENANEAGKPA